MNTIANGISREQREEILERINSFLVGDIIRVNEYAGDLAEVYGSIPYRDAIYIQRKLDLEDDLNNILIEINPCGGCRDSGSLNKANYSCFFEEFGDLDDVICSYGAYDTYAIFIRPWLLLNKDIYDTLVGLSDYPAINDIAVAEAESAMIEEAWDNWARSEFERSLEKHLNLWGDIEAEDEDLKKVFDLGRDRTNQYWHEESGGMYIDVDKVASSILLDDLTENDIGFELMDDED